jgi:hypothetical protein
MRQAGRGRPNLSDVANGFAAGLTDYRFYDGAVNTDSAEPRNCLVATPRLGRSRSGSTVRPCHECR